jgi:hypothetical protein
MHVFNVFKHLDILWMGAWVQPLHCDTHAGRCQRMLENGGVGEPKIHCGVMVETARCFRLHHTSVLDVCYVF